MMTSSAQIVLKNDSKSGGNSTTSPITDIKQRSKSPSSMMMTTTTTQPRSSSSNSTSTPTTSKIPYPLASLLAGRTDQFRRSASLRLRGTKSNLLLLPQRIASKGNNLQNHFDTMTMGNEKASTHTCIDGNGTSTTMKKMHSQESAKSDVHISRFAHDRTDICDGCPISPRRKLVLTCSATTENSRSLSLNSATTDSNTDLSTAEADPPKTLAVDISTKTTVRTGDPYIAKNLTSGDIGESKSVRSTEGHLNRPPSTNGGTAAKVMDGKSSSPQIAHQTTRKRDTNQMSLNLNGPAITNRPVSLTVAKSSAATSPSSTATTPSTAKTPKTPNYHHHHSKYPLATVPETKLTPKTPPVTPDSPSTYLDDDIDSLYSFATTTSGRSTMSCEHPYVARNGTTFSGRKMKYVVHCSNYAGQVGEDYLTPTQRAQRQIRRLKELLCVARHDLEQKDSEILRLTREVVELRLFKASLSSPEDRSNSSDAITVREADLKTSQDVSPIVDMVDDGIKSSPRHIVHHHNHHHHQLHSEMQSSFADSGHFEDMTTSSIHSKDSFAAHHTHDIACGGDDEASGGRAVASTESYEEQHQELIRMYEQRIEELIKTQDSASSDMKRTHNDKVEALLQKLAECNTRYADIVPDHELAKERIRELEKQLEDLQRKLAEHEEKQNKMYLHMYQKGQEAERIARADQALELVHKAPNKVSITELLHQLQSTQDELENIRAAECRKECGSNHALLTAKEAISLWVLGARKTIYRRLLDAQKNKTHVDPDVTLQFLKSAVYYFLTDKENSQGHLQAIESILEFTEAEKQNISKARSPK